MPKTSRLRRPTLSLALLGAASLAVCPLSPRWAGALQSEGACAQATPAPRPSYDSFFGLQGPVQAESPKWRIDLVRAQAARECLNQVAFLFHVRDKRNGTTSQFRLCNETAQVDEVDLINGARALVLGRVTGSVPVANVVQLPSGKVENHFECYRPALSPLHHFLAFVKMFPPHPGPVAIRFDYIVYDLTRSPEYNRPHFKPGLRYDAGWPIYPPGATNADMENVLPEGSPANSPTSRSLFWLDDNTLAFGDFFEGHNRLVVADLTGGVTSPDVRTSDLDPSQIVDLDRCKKSTAPSDFEVWSKKPAGLIQIKQIDPVPERPGMACLYFVSTPCLRFTDLMVKLP